MDLEQFRKLVEDLTVPDAVVREAIGQVDLSIRAVADEYCKIGELSRTLRPGLHELLKAEVRAICCCGPDCTES